MAAVLRVGLCLKELRSSIATFAMEAPISMGVVSVVLCLIIVTDRNTLQDL